MDASADSFFERGDALEEQGLFEEAFEQFTIGANAGDADCMTRLALMYTLGKGIECCDYDKAIEWEKRAHEAGSALAQFNLGITYRLKGNLLDARACFESVLSAGDNSAALELAKLYVVSPKESETVRNYLELVLADESICEADRDEARALLSRIQGKPGDASLQSVRPR